MNEEIAEEFEFYKMEDFEYLDKIDMHVHMNTNERYLLEQAEADNFKLLTINVDYPAFPPVEEQFDIASTLTKSKPDRLAFATTFFMAGWEKSNWQDISIEYIRKAIVKGACAVKVWKNIGMDFRDRQGKLVMIDDSKFDKVITFIKNMNVPLIGHLGEPKDCWLPKEDIITNYLKDYYSEHPEYHMFMHPEFPSYEEQMSARDRMLEKNKDIVFVGAHFASLEWSVDRIAKFLDSFPLSSVDSSARMGEIQFQTVKDRVKVRNFFIKYQDRITYGTDLFQEPKINGDIFKREVHDKWLSDWRFLTTEDKMRVSNIEGDFYGLNLPKPVIDKIYRDNAKKIFSKAWKAN